MARAKAKLEPQLGFSDVWAWCSFDTETNGLFDRERHYLEDGQPRLAALTLIRCTPGWSMTRTERFFVKPEGWKMTPDATEVNGITDEFLHAHGKPIAEVLDAYEMAIREGRAMVAFNARFDLKIMRAELERAGRDHRFDTTPYLDLMGCCTGVVKGKKMENGGYKMPTLAEAMAHFKIPQHGAHTATGDALSVVRLGHRLSEIGFALKPTTLKRRPPDEK